MTGKTDLEARKVPHMEVPAHQCIHVLLLNAAQLLESLHRVRERQKWLHGHRLATKRGKSTQNVGILSGERYMTHMSARIREITKTGNNSNRQNN